MKRRNFLKIAGGAAVATGAAVSAPAISLGRRQLRMVTSWPIDLPGMSSSANRVATRIRRASRGRLEVKVYPGGELVHALEANDAVQQGTADLYHSAEYYYQNKIKAYAFFTAVPFGMTATEMNAWIHHGGGQKIWDEVSAQFGIKPFMAGNTGVQMGGWFKKPMRSLSDFKGITMRIPGLGGDVIQSLGGNSVDLAGSEIYPSLQAGTIDAAEWVGPWNDLVLGFYKVLKDYHFPGFQEPGTVLSLGINLKVWEGLSSSLKQVIQDAAGAENDYGLAEFNAKNSAALYTLVNKHGVRVHEFSDDMFKAIGTVARDVVATAGNADPLTRKVYKSFMDFRKLAMGWATLSEQTYLVKRALNESLS